ncbi:hypothetical protein ACHAXA_002130 [Cyclostephanos tholiformis]|uniref:Uncharacterized protein n=1 Tax=Cyclostephanos tholiformis TaxID=382380 RepID=A0ABD3RT88_9STRA
MESADVVVDGRGGGVPVPDQRDADFDAFLSYFNSQEVQQERRRGTMITTRIDNFDFLPDQHGDTVEALWSRIVSGMSDAPPEPPSWFWSWFGQTSTAAQGEEMRRKMESKGGYGDAYPAAAAIVNGQVEPPSWFGSWFGYSSAAQVQPVEAHRGVDTAEHEDSFV